MSRRKDRSVDLDEVHALYDSFVRAHGVAPNCLVVNKGFAKPLAYAIRDSLCPDDPFDETFEGGETLYGMEVLVAHGGGKLRVGLLG